MTSKPIHPNPPRWQPNPDPASIVVPGLDTSASMLDQIEQMEQLITIKLQNVDENFSKIHNVLATRILPAVKRYAAATKPVREAANFWVSFYEQAAQIRIPTYDDYSTVNEVPSERDDLASEAEYSSRVADRTVRHEEQSVAATENSFMPPHAAFTSSTPAMSRVGRSMEDTFAGDHSGAPSWSASLESPLTRLDREVQNFTREDSSHSSKLPPLHLGEPPVEQEEETVMLPRIDNRKGKGKVLAEPLLQSVLRHTLYSTTDVSLSAHSPTKGKLKTPVPAGLNPYLPQDTEPANWSGLVDLRRTPLSTPRKNPTDSDDDSFDGLPPGMSPPVLMSPARPPRSTAELQLLRGKTPAKEAAARIKNDLVREAQRQNSAKSRRVYGYPTSGGESSLSTVASPPSLSRYNKLDTDDSAVDTSLESVMHRVALDPPTWTPRGNTPALRLRPKPTASTFVRPDSQSAPTYLAPPTHPQLPAGQYEPRANIFSLPAATPLRYDAELGDDSFDSDSDSLDEVNNTAHPSAAFLMAQAASSSFDDDDSLESQDSLYQADAGALALEGIVDVHPFALARGGFVNAADNSFDESFDDGGLPREETVFGRPPARAQASRLSAQGELLMYGDEASVVPDTMQYGMAASSPTPHWSGGSRD
ncbi:DASH complex subunit Ask1-domain-containing protein [Mycena pura]|uniref:DASH complex subunit ASK1 n=1 Tax=Mycena pura TaxID=153505 RepID=A0AAD6UTX1_9AGAR|nr:DASH complex subunit Ask1-domain-containing protein [Mycena pura]